MGRIAAIGPVVRVQGLGLAGVLVLPGEDDEQVRSSWAALPDDVDLVILAPEAAGIVGASGPGPLRAVMPP